MAMPVFNLAPDMTVSKLCLGTMTFGEQNTLPQSFQLLDKAFNSGINFFDSAEMYPVPQRAETQGRSEEYIGRWIQSRRIPRDRVVIATKVSGPSGQMTWIRNGPESLDSRNITEAINNSLLRLQSDHIDLYQVHWPDRYVPMFGETEYDPTQTYASVSFEEQLSSLEKAISNGKIRYIGFSNETPYGLMKFLHAAEGLSIKPRIVSLQNSYNLLCRTFDSGLAECCHQERLLRKMHLDTHPDQQIWVCDIELHSFADLRRPARISLLAYSPLAMGILSGKYLSLEGSPADARLNHFKGRYAEGESRYNLSNAIIRKATKSYVSIAKEYGIHPVSLSIAFVLRHPLVASAVFGATKLWQLQEVLDGWTLQLTSEIVAEINRIHSEFPNPCP